MAVAETGAIPDAAAPAQELTLRESITVVFKLGSADQRGSATGSHGVRERILKSSNCLHGF